LRRLVPSSFLLILVSYVDCSDDISPLDLRDLTRAHPEGLSFNFHKRAANCGHGRIEN
jgi:hypothetical protein